MRQVASNNLYGTFFEGNEQLQLCWQLTLHQVGKKFLLEISDVSGGGGYRRWETSIEIDVKTGRTVDKIEVEKEVDLKLLRAELEKKVEEATARLERVKRFETRPGGLLVPASPDATVLVDEPGGGSVTIFSRDAVGGEEIEKKAVEVKDNACTCPIKVLTTSGCPRLRGAQECAR